MDTPAISTHQDEFTFVCAPYFTTMPRLAILNSYKHVLLHLTSFSCSHAQMRQIYDCLFLFDVKSIATPPIMIFSY